MSKAKQHDSELLQALREVLEQGEWLQSLAPDGSDGYQMDGGLWLDGDTFNALFPDRAASPAVVMLSSKYHPANICGYCEGSGIDECNTGVYGVRCRMCGGTGWHHDNSGLPDDPCPECAARGYTTTRCDLCGQHVPDAQVRRIGDTAVCEACAEQRGE